MSGSDIESELQAELAAEMSRRTSKLPPPPPEPSDDLVASLCLSALLALLALLAGTGVAMALGYAPAADDAVASLAWLELSFAGRVLRAAHFHASNLVVLLALATLGYMVWRGLYRRPGHWRWWRVAVLLLLLLAAGFTGQLLPFDQNALHGTQIRLGYLGDVPVVGPLIADFLRAGDEPGTAALARFYALHVLVIPALLLLLLRPLWRDARANGGQYVHFGAAGAVLALVLLAAFVVPAPLGMQGTLAEPYADARPEWYALPLYELLKLMPAGAAQTLMLVLGPLLFAVVVVALPFAERVAAEPERLKLPARIGLGVVLVAMLLLGALPLLQDSSDKRGWFASYDVEGLMLAMGSRNDALGPEDATLPPNAHLHAHDLRLLHERLIGVYPDDIDADARTKWDAWARDGASAALALFKAADSDAQQQALKDLRQACTSCHEAHEVDVIVNPLAQTQGGAALTPMFFDTALLASLEPRELRARGTKRIMDQARFRMRDILAHAGIVDDVTDRSKEQALVDLRHISERIASLWEDNAGSWFDEDKWQAWSREMIAAVDRLALATDREDLAERMAELGRTCEACHDGGDEPDMPIEWRYRNLLQ